VIIPGAVNIDLSWRSMATETSGKMAIFSHLFASGISYTSTKHISRVFQSLGGANWRLLTPFPCITYISLPFNNNISNLNGRRSNSSTDLHEVFRYPPNRQDLQQNRETFRRCPVSCHTWATMIHRNIDWEAIVPIFPHGGKFDLPKWHDFPSKKINMV
jgi:hypothetical protein